MFLFSYLGYARTRTFIFPLVLSVAVEDVVEPATLNIQSEISFSTHPPPTL